MKSFFARLLYGGSSKLYEYESLCIDCFLKKQNSEIQIIIDKQIKLVDVIQRFSKDKIVTLHFLKKENVPRVENRAAELTVARVTIDEVSNFSSFFCEIVFHDGLISSLEFNRPPKSLAVNSYHCVKVVEFSNLNVKSSAIKQAQDFIPQLLGRISNKFEIKNILPPVSPSERDSYIFRLNTELPVDYLELLCETDGFSVEDWQFHGTNSRRIMRDNENYQVLAENDERAICLLENNTSPQVFYLDQIKDEVTEEGENFINAFLKILE